jgi:hypothetical protein
MNYEDIKEGYMDAKDSHIDIKKYPRVIIQYESLLRLDGQFNDTLVIMDESESIISQINNSGDTQRSRKMYCKFYGLIAQCKKLICMDANLGDRTHEVISSILGKENPIKLYDYSYRNMKSYTVHITCNHGRYINHMCDMLKAGKKICVFTNSRKTADSLFDKFADIVGLDKLMIYAGKDATKSDHVEGISREQEKITHLDEDINNAVKSFQCVIITPCFTAGVSIKDPHFDQVYGYFTDRSADVLQCCQMLGRVRNVADKEMFLCFRPVYNGLPTTVNDVFDKIDADRHLYMIDNIDDLKNIEMDKVFDRTTFKYLVDRTSCRNIITAYNIIEHNKSRNYFGYYMLQVLRRAGVTIKKMFGAATEANRKAHAELVKTIKDSSKRNTIRNARDLINTEITDDYEPNEKAVTREDILGAKLSFIKKYFDINDSDMNALRYGEYTHTTTAHADNNITKNLSIIFWYI